MDSYLVIGAGVLGASTAYYLAKMGAHVKVIDARIPGQATDAAAGVICPWLTQRRNQTWYTLAKNGAKFYTTLIHHLEADGQEQTGYKKVGAISIHYDLERLQKIKERALKRREDAPEMGSIKQLNEEETRKLFPPVQEGYSAIFISGGARVNGRALCKALLQAAQKQGAEFIYGKAEICHKDGVILGVKVNDESIPANKIIVTAGAWTQELLKPLGLDFQLTFQKGQIVHLQMEREDTSTWPVVMPPGNQNMLAFDHGEIIIGSTHEKDVGFNLHVTAGGIYEILDKAMDVAPGLAQAYIKEFRVGFRPYTPNFLPMFGEVPHFPGLYIANGLGASGLTVGPYLGFQLASLVLGKPLEIDLQHYNIANVLVK